ncbi:MAG: ABC transporter permease [Sandaracinus sp.]|nr:ABC transporter permease [Sandaracinus sp.]
MAYAFQIGRRYLRSKKRSRMVSVITFIAVAGVALGVAALLSVLAITTGFQQEFREKVLGVNAHVLVMKYGVDFDEYRDVIQRADDMPEVAGVGPFLINEMMLAKGDRLAGVLVKGVDPELMPSVLDLPSQLVQGSLRGLRREGAEPPPRPTELGEVSESWGWLEEMGDGEGDEGEGAEPAASDIEMGSPEARDLAAELGVPEGDLFGEDGALLPARRQRAAWDLDDPSEPEVAAGPDEGEGDEFEPLPEVDTLSPEDMNDLLADFDPEELDTGSEWEEQLVDDDLERERQDQQGTDELPGIVVGKSLAQNLGLGVGDRVTLVSPLAGLDVSAFAPDAQAPRSREFMVIAIFEAGFQEYDTRLVYTDLYEAQHFYGQGDAVTGVEIRLHDLERSAEIARRLERDLGGPFHTLDWAELNRNLFTALEIQKVTLGLVIATIIFVAAFNVIATLIMIVLEKKREIAILKAMGATDWTVLNVFVLQGLVIGIIGTLIGLLIGGGLIAYLATFEFALDPKVYLIDHLPVVFDGSELVITSLVAVAICTVATIAPSAWAARMLPVEGLRYE